VTLAYLSVVGKEYRYENLNSPKHPSKSVFKTFKSLYMKRVPWTIPTWLCYQTKHLVKTSVLAFVFVLWWLHKFNMLLCLMCVL